MRMLFATTTEAVVQLSSNRIIRGRVMALYTMIAVGGQAAGSPLMGWIAEVAGARAAMIVSGVVPVARRRRRGGAAGAFRPALPAVPTARHLPLMVIEPRGQLG